MTHRRASAVDRRVKPHIAVENPDAPGCCLTCGVRMDLKTRNELHVDQLPPVDPAIADAERRRLGEHD